MRSIKVILKDGNGNPFPLNDDKPFAIEEKELERLKSDFLDAPISCGVYECSSHGKQHDVFLKFCDVLSIY